MAGAATNQYDDRLNLSKGWVGDREVTVMRDSGSTICTLRHSLARSHEFTGKRRKIWLLNSAPVIAPEVKIQVRSPYYTGWIMAVTLETLLYDLVIGNIPGVTNGVSKNAVTQTPNAVLDPEDFGEGERVQGEGEPQIDAAVVTRAAAKRKRTVRPLMVTSLGDLTNSEDVRKEVESDDTLHGVRKRLQEKCHSAERQPLQFYQAAWLEI